MQELHQQQAHIGAANMKLVAASQGSISPLQSHWNRFAIPGKYRFAAAALSAVLYCALLSSLELPASNAGFASTPSIAWTRRTAMLRSKTKPVVGLRPPNLAWDYNSKPCWLLVHFRIPNCCAVPCCFMLDSLHSSCLPAVFASHK